MSKPIEYQTIEHCGHPAYVLVPWEEWRRIKPLLEAEKARASGIPQEVVEAMPARRASYQGMAGISWHHPGRVGLPPGRIAGGCCQIRASRRPATDHHAQ